MNNRKHHGCSYVKPLSLKDKLLFLAGGTITLGLMAGLMPFYALAEIIDYDDKDGNDSCECYRKEDNEAWERSEYYEWYGV